MTHNKIRFRDYILPVLGFLMLIGSLVWVMLGDTISILNWAMIAISVVVIILGYWWQESGSSRETFASLLYSFFIFISLICVYLISANHDDTYDLTEYKLHTLSPQSVSVIRGVADPLNIVAFVPLSKHEMMADFLELYAKESPRVRYQIFDPSLDIEVAQQIDDNVLANDLFLVMDKDGDVRQTRTVVDPADPRKERFLTNAILQAERGQQEKLYFTTGKGEREVEPEVGNEEALSTSLKTFTDYLEAQVLPIASLNLQSFPQVPDDASVVVIASPTVDLLDSEKLMLIDFLDEGGSILLLYDPNFQQDRLDNLEELINYAGIGTENDVIIDPQAASVLNGIVFGTATNNHPIVANASQSELFKFFIVRSLFAAPDLSEKNPRVSPLIVSNSTVWSEDARYLSRVNNPRRPTDQSQYFSRNLMMASSWDTPNGIRGDKARVVVVGDADVLTNQLIENSELTLGIYTINWLAKRDDQIAIPPRMIPPSSFDMTTKRLYVFIGILLIISLALLAGGVTYSAARRRAG